MFGVVLPFELESESPLWGRLWLQIQAKTSIPGDS